MAWILRHRNLEKKVNGGAGRKDQRHIEVHITSNIYQQSWKDPEKCTKTHVYIHKNTHTHY